MNINDLTYQIIGCAYKVHANLGPGLLESTYEVCLEYELIKSGMTVHRQVALPVVYDDIKLDAGYRIDLIVNDTVIIEIKSVETLAPIHTAQILTYLKLADKKIGGVLVWVVGDAVIDGGESGTSFRQALYFQQIGFIIHDTMIYEKNGAAYPANDKSNRYSQVFEYMFVLSKGKPKTYNLLKDKPNRWAGSGTFGTNSERQKDGTIKERGSFIVPEFSYRNNIWKINNGYGYSSEDDIAHKHPAIFPEQLAQDHIWTWSNEGDVVYDCFGGSGTTAKMAHKLKRNWILSEISSEYVQIAEKRIAPYLAQTLLF